jgi:hypothetical protein
MIRSLALAALAAQAACGAAGPAASPGPTRIAIMPVGSVGLPLDEAARVRAIVREEVVRGSGTALVDDGRVDAAAARSAACVGAGTDPERLDQCGARVGAALGASHALVGAIGALGRTYLVQLRVIDVARATPVRSLEETLFGDVAGLRGAARSLAGRLLELPRPRAWYARWWLWTALGVAVAAAVAIPVGIVASRARDDGYKDVPLP